MRSTPAPTPLALFVALSRAVRDAAVTEDTRLRAYEVIARMGHAVGLPAFEVELEAFTALATGEPQFFATLEPFWPELGALSAASGA